MLQTSTEYLYNEASKKDNSCDELIPLEPTMDIIYYIRDILRAKPVDTAFQDHNNFKIFYSNQKIAWELIGDAHGGGFNGEFRRYFPNGKLKEVVPVDAHSIINGNRMDIRLRILGDWKEYHPNGQLKTRKPARYETPSFNWRGKRVYPKGLMHGKCFNYNEIRQLIGETEYKNGKLKPKSAKTYHPSGREISSDALHYVAPLTLVKYDDDRILLKNQYDITIGIGALDEQGCATGQWEFPNEKLEFPERQYGYFHEGELITHSANADALYNHRKVKEILAAEVAQDFDRHPLPETPDQSVIDTSQLQAQAAHQLIKDGVAAIPAPQKKQNWWHRNFSDAAAAPVIVPKAGQVSIAHTQPPSPDKLEYN